jgi:hypothetical protein
VLFVLGFVWALPTTIVGLVLGLLTFQVPRIHGGALVFDRRGARGLAAMLAASHRTAMAVGFVIVSSVPVEGRLLAHEREHVRQAMRWGPFFIPAYLLLAVPYGYRRHPMERRARLAAGEDP